MRVNCPHSIPVFGSLCHCGSCCRTFSALSHFDSHRFNGRCYVSRTIEGKLWELTEVDGVWSTPEGHEQRAGGAARAAVARQGRTKR